VSAVTQVTNVLMVGVGGQGIILASSILAQAAAESGLDVKKSEVHGMAQRGGAVSSHVRFGKKVYSPLIPAGEADILFGSELLETYRWLPHLKEGGRVIANTQKIDPPAVLRGESKYPEGILEKFQAKDPHTIAFNALDEAVALGDARVATVLLVGALSRLLKFDQELWLKKVRELVPKKAVELNLLAFQKGLELASA
jgi:indolepyruvate ferredoxin oxidoreductase, beta subunit